MSSFEGAPQQKPAPSDAEVLEAFQSTEKLGQAKELFRAWEIAQLERAQKANTMAEMLAIEIEIAQMFGQIGLVREARDRLEDIVASVTEQEALADAANSAEPELHAVHVEALMALQALPAVH